jgi:hypothetical protein
VLEGTENEPSLALSLNVAPTSDERLAALEDERDREQAAVRDLEARLAEAVANRSALNERARFRRTLLVTFVLGVLGLVFGFFALVGGIC